MIREAYRQKCEFCGHDLDSHEDGVYQFVEGWSMNRGRGTHAVALETRHRRWAHHHCVENAKSHPTSQGGLFK